MIAALALILASSLSVSTASARGGFPALLADRPDPAQAEKLSTFGQFVGSWTFEGTEYHDDGTRATDKGELQFHWILDGEAIQDVWTETARSDNAPKVLGTTLRFYDPKTDTWRITWVHPRYSAVKTLTGRRSGNDIILEGSTPEGEPYRWIFSEITRDSFRWHSERLVGGQWRTKDDLRARRKPGT